MTRTFKRYVRPKRVDYHVNSASYHLQNADALDSVLMRTASSSYEECAKLLDQVSFDLARAIEKYHVIVDKHGPLYHVEVIDFVAQLEKIEERLHYE